MFKFKKETIIPANWNNYSFLKKFMWQSVPAARVEYTSKGFQFLCLLLKYYQPLPPKYELAPLLMSWGLHRHNIKRGCMKSGKHQLVDKSKTKNLGYDKSPLWLELRRRFIDCIDVYVSLLLSWPIFKSRILISHQLESWH